MLKKNLIRVPTILLALCLAFSLTAFAVPGQQKSSNGNGHAYGNAARYMLNHGILRGDGNGNYNLSGNIKRGDFMIMLVRAYNLNSNAGGNNFNDVPSNSYYHDAIDAARYNGIAMGDGKNFMPNRYVTIEQAILFIERAMKKAGVELDFDLRSLYDESALSNYATREDVSELLYYALTGNIDGFDGKFNISVTYSIDKNETVTFDKDDFSDAFNDATNKDLSYVKFTSLPSASAGVLYYEYDKDDSSHTKVDKSTSYDIGDLDDIIFVSADDYSGFVSISFIGYSENEVSCRGTVKIAIDDTNEDITADLFTITTDENEAVTLGDSAFISVCDDATSENLSYVKFTSLPSDSTGILYYDYDEDDSSHTKIDKNTLYDVGDLDDIVFVPASGYSGTVTLSYTGYTDNDTVYTGYFKMTVKDIEDTAATINYYTDEDEALTFDVSDFQSVCLGVTGKSLSGVKFTLPNSTEGVLYYNYDKNDDINTKVSTAKAYCVSAYPLLSKVTFVPADDGTVEISYTGYTANATTYTGTVIIVVS